MDNSKLSETVADLLKRIKVLEQRRIYQQDIPSDVVKQRHVGEGVRFIRSGLASARPDEGEGTLQGSAFFFATDTGILSVWNGSVWRDFAPLPTSPAVYAASNVTTDRTYDADTVVVAELADIVGTLVADLRAIGLID